MSLYCPHCGEELEGGNWGDHAYCKVCDISFETDWDYTSYDSAVNWLTGIEHKGKID